MSKELNTKKIFLFFLKGQDHLESLNATDYKGRRDRKKEEKILYEKGEKAQR